jgi:hypothetical protein
MNRPLVVIFAAVALDAVGIGLISPILPRLLVDVTHVQNIALFIGIMTALYAIMQFIFARRMQQRIETVLPAIVVAKRDAYYTMRNNVSGFKPQPFAPFGAIMGGDVSK